MSDTVQRETEERSSEELREEQVVLRTLVKHPGWVHVMRYATFQQGVYQREALRPVQSIDNVPGNEFTKGVAQGITEVLSLPDQLLEEIETELATRAARMSQSDGEKDDGYDDEH